MKMLFSDEKKVQEPVFDDRRWQGPPKINKVQQYETVFFFEVRVYLEVNVSIWTRLFFFTKFQVHEMCH